MTEILKLPKQLILFFKYTWIYFAVALVIAIAGFNIINMIYPTTYDFNYTWEGILMFMVVCAGVGWVIHGTGFLIVKVN